MMEIKNMSDQQSMWSDQQHYTHFRIRQLYNMTSYLHM